MNSFLQEKKKRIARTVKITIPLTFHSHPPPSLHLIHILYLIIQQPEQMLHFHRSPFDFHVRYALPTRNIISVKSEYHFVRDRFLRSSCLSFWSYSTADLSATVKISGSDWLYGTSTEICCASRHKISSPLYLFNRVKSAVHSINHFNKSIIVEPKIF